MNLLSRWHRADFRCSVGPIALAMALASGMAHGQAIGISGTDVLSPPSFKTVDANGVDLITGQLSPPYERMSVGQAGSGLSRIGRGLRDDVASTWSDSSIILLTHFVWGTGQNDEFLISGSGFSGSFGYYGLNVPDFADGSQLSQIGNNLVYYSSQGDVIVFKSGSCGQAYCLATTSADKLLALSWTKPDGEVITFNGSGGSQESSAGWMLKYDYSSASPGYLNQVTAINTAYEPQYCALSAATCTYSLNWPQFKYTDSTYNAGTPIAIQDANGNTYNLLKDIPISGSTNAELTFTMPSGMVYTYVYDSSGRILSVNNGIGTWTYAYSDGPNAAKDYRGPHSSHTHTVTVTDPNGGVTKVYSESQHGNPLSLTDELNRVTTITYDFNTQKPSQIVYPEGNQETFSYDARGNVVQETKIAKPGSSLPNQVLTAGHDTTCSSMAKCNKPNWVKDALGNETDYAYDNTTGLLLTVTKPADSNGVRPITAYSYQQIATYSRNSSSGLSQTGSIWKPTVTATCQKTAGSVAISGLTSTLTCAGGSTDLMLTTTSYSGSLNALPMSVTQADGAGSVSATTTYSYDATGNVAAVDGPRTDVDDRSYRTYDLMRRLVFEIGTDPDGSGPLQRVVVKHTYDGDGREIKTERGSGSATDGSDFVATNFSRMTYDAAGRLIKTEQVQP